MGLDPDSGPNRQWIPHQIRFRTSIQSKFPVPDTHSGPNTIPTAQPLPELFICFLSSFSSLSFPLSLFPPSKIQYWQHRVVKILLMLSISDCGLFPLFPVSLASLLILVLTHPHSSYHLSLFQLSYFIPSDSVFSRPSFSTPLSPLPHFPPHVRYVCKCSF